MLSIEKQSGVPIYEQIVSQLQRMILTGLLKPDEQIPSVRTLSLDISVNPNTIQKAYSELEMRKITYSVPGVGRFVSKNAKEIIGKQYLDRLDGLYRTAFELALADVPQALATQAVVKAYKAANKDREEDDQL